MTNRLGIPAEIMKTDSRPELCTTVHWEAAEKNLVLCSYAVKTKSRGMKSLLLLSTMRVLLGVIRDDGKRKPAIFKAHDFTKGRADIVDQKMSSLSCKAKSARWKMVAFYYILDTGFELATALLRPHGNKMGDGSIHRPKQRIITGRLEK